MKDSRTGGSNLLLVLIIGMLLMLLSTATLLYTYLSTKISTQQVNSLQAEYAAEGILLDTYNLISSDRWNSTTPQDYIFTLDNGVVIRRQVEFVNGQYNITVTAQSGGSLRSFKGTVGTSTQQVSKPLDIVIVIDHSSSMSDDDINDATLKANHFAQSLLDQPSLNARIGIVKFDETVYKTHLDKYLIFTSDKFKVEKILVGESDKWLDGSGTNIARSLKTAKEMFIDAGRAEAQKILVFFSDGAANQGDKYSTNVCDSGYCLHPNTSGYAPLDHGYICSQEVIDYADEIKDLDAKIYAISYTKNFTDTEDRCKTASWWGNTATAIEKTQQLARLTLLLSTSEENKPTDVNYTFENNLTYYKESDSLEDLDQMFSDITDTIVSGLDFHYTTVDPQPIPN